VIGVENKRDNIGNIYYRNIDKKNREWRLDRNREQRGDKNRGEKYE